MPRLQQVLRTRAVALYRFGREYLRLVARPLEVARAWRNPTVGRAFPVFARHSRRTVLTGTAGLVGGALVVRRVAPRLLLPAAGGLAAAVAGDRWITSAARGRRHNWPPGPRGTTPESWVDPDHFTDRARRYGPIFSSNFLGEPMACVMGNGRAIDLLREHEKALRHSSFDYFSLIPGGSFRDKQGVAHKQDRAVLAGGLTQRLVDTLAPRLRAEFDALLETMAAASQRDGGVSPFEWLDSEIFRVWQYAFFALDPNPASLEELRNHYLAARFMGSGGRRPTVADAEDGLRAIEAAIRANLRPGLDDGTAPVCFLTEVLRRHPGAIDDPHLLRVLIYLSNTTSRDTTGLLTWLAKHLSDHPASLDALREEAAPGTDPGVGSLADHVVSETLRMEQSEYLNLVITDDVELGGYTLPEGWRLRVCVHENHRDPAVFDDPDTYRPERWTGRKYTRAEYAPFGMDDHSCLGEALARATGRAFVLALARYEVRVVDDGPREFTARYHFAPNAQFRVRLTARR